MLFYGLISIDQCRNWTQANWNVSILIRYARDTRYYVTIFVNNNLYWHINLYWLVRVNLLVWSCVRKLDELFLVDSHNILEKYHVGSLSSINSTKFRNIVSVKEFFEYGTWFNCCKALTNTIYDIWDSNNFHSRYQLDNRRAEGYKSNTTTSWPNSRNCVENYVFFTCESICFQSKKMLPPWNFMDKFLESFGNYRRYKRTFT